MWKDSIFVLIYAWLVVTRMFIIPSSSSENFIYIFKKQPHLFSVIVADFPIFIEKVQNSFMESLNQVTCILRIKYIDQNAHLFTESNALTLRNTCFHLPVI